MNFDIPESHREIQRSVREFCLRHVAPDARRWDDEERFPRELVPLLAEQGLLGVRIPDTYGGAGLDTLALALIVEEIAKFDGSLALTVAAHNSLGAAHILAFGAEAQRERYLTRAASGEWLAAWALTEPDAMGMRTTAVRRDEGWVLDGALSFTSLGAVGGFCVVFAVTSPERGPQGITAFVVEQGAPGFRASRSIEKLGMRASDTAEVVLEGCFVPDENRVGEVDGGYLDALQTVDRMRVALGALALGLGEGALDAAVTYAKDRKQFGKPIADFQAIQWMLADSRAELDAARMLVHRAALLADGAARSSAEASMARLYASEAASRVCSRALQVHGGYGYTREFLVERHLRDAKLCEIAEGTSEVQRAIIAGHLLAAG